MEHSNISSSPRSPAAPLSGAIGAALLIQACCIGPLLLVALGVGGAWAGQLQALEKFQPLFIGLALVCLGFAARSVYGRAACADGAVCARPGPRRWYRAAFWFAFFLLTAGVVIPYAAPLFY